MRGETHRHTRLLLGPPGAAPLLLSPKVLYPLMVARATFSGGSAEGLSNSDPQHRHGTLATPDAEIGGDTAPSA